MKKSIYTAAALLATCAVANANLLAGWDFSTFVFAGNDLDSSFSGSVSPLASNYSDLVAGNGDVANPFGTASWAAGPTAYSPNLTAGQGLGGLSTTAGSFDSLSIADQALGVAPFALQTGGTSVTFQLTPGDSFNSLALQFGGVARSGTATIDILAGSSLGSLSGVGSTFNLTGAQDVYNLDLSSLGTVGNGFYVQFTSSSEAVFDNVAFTGTVVPEPSAFAAIFGAVALGFVGLRRRK